MYSGRKIWNKKRENVDRDRGDVKWRKRNVYGAQVARKSSFYALKLLPFECHTFFLFLLFHKTLENICKIGWAPRHGAYNVQFRCCRSTQTLYRFSFCVFRFVFRSASTRHRAHRVDGKALRALVCIIPHRFLVIAMLPGVRGS